MTPKRLALLSGLTVALAAPVVASAGPLDKAPTLSPTQVDKSVNPVSIPQGVTGSVTIQPRQMYVGQAWLDMINPGDLLIHKNQIQVGKHTQATLTFRTAPNRSYRVTCKFTESTSIHTIQKFDGTFAGTQDHHARTQVDYVIDRASQSRRVELTLFPRSDTEWKSCKIVAQ